MSASIQIPTVEDIRAVVREEVERALRSVPHGPSQLLTVAQAAQLLGVSQRTVRRQIASGEIPVVRVGRAVRIDPAVISPDPARIAQLARGAIAA